MGFSDYTHLSMHCVVLCCVVQLVKDSIGVSEATNWSSRGSAEGKYRSLRCDIQLLDPTSPEYADISNHVYNTQDRYGHRE